MVSGISLISFNDTRHIAKNVASPFIDFVAVRLTEETVWQTIENASLAYEDWTAYKEAGEPVLHLFIELKDGCLSDEADIAASIHKQVMTPPLINPSNSVRTLLLAKPGEAKAVAVH